MVAADANNSESITAIDLIELRKLILGIYTELPNNTSWRFVDKTYVFPDPYNPWMQEWPENHILNPLALGMNHADFYGIKIGDVNNTVKANATSIVPRGSGQIFDLVIDDQSVTAGETFEVPVYAAKGKSLEGMQFSFDLGQGLQLVTVKAGLMDVTEDNFGWLQNRTLTSSWNKAEGLDVNETQALFTLVLKASAAGKLSEGIALVANPTAAEAYTTDSDIMDLALSFRGAEERYDFELLQNEPNPFTSTTQIGYVIPESGQVILTMFDLTGKQLFNQTITGVKGLNKVEISKDQIGAQGMIYYQVQFQGYTATKKMLIL
jgi:large repetitive protein